MSNHSVPDIGWNSSAPGDASVLPDRIERLAVLAQTLVAHPTWEELARLLVLRIFDAWSCRGALVLAPVPDGTLALHAAFGYPAAQLDDLAVLPLELDSPMHRAISSDETVWFPDLIDVIEARGEDPIALPDACGLIVAPLTRLGIPLLVLVLSFDDPLPTNPASGPFVVAVKSLLELHLGVSDPRRAADAVSHAAGQPDGRKVSAQDVALSSRQRRVLELLSQEKTNRSIAVELGFSESTIRQETLRLYRALNVNGRRQAVEVAETLGLLGRSDGSAQTTDPVADSGTTRSLSGHGR